MKCVQNSNDADPCHWCSNTYLYAIMADGHTKLRAASYDNSLNSLADINSVKDNTDNNIDSYDLRKI